MDLLRAVLRYFVILCEVATPTIAVSLLVSYQLRYCVRCQAKVGSWKMM